MNTKRTFTSGLLRILACVAAAWALAIAPAAAEDAKDKESTFRKTERGFGNLLQGMNQEIKKVWSSAPKKQEKKPEKPAGKKAE